VPSHSSLSRADAPILFVHGSLSSGKMWTRFSSLLGRTRPLLAPDLLGYGSSPPWSGVGLQLRDEARRLRSANSGPVDVVAHSYGAAVALRLLADAPEFVRSMVLIEPACFFLLPDLGPRAASDRQEIAALRHRIQTRFEKAEPIDAASQFVDYWNGPGAFSTMPNDAQRRLASRIGKVIADFDAIASDRLRLACLRKRPVPTLVVLGDRGPKGPQLIGEAVARAMPRGSSTRIAGAGHMLPVTHGAELAGVLYRWLGVEQRTPLSQAA
jgi:pimeloyl-ACP methyl ester carboxylesterase